MIELKNVSMKFNLGIEKSFSLKEALIIFFNLKRRKNMKIFML